MAPPNAEISPSRLSTPPQRNGGPRMRADSTTSFADLNAVDTAVTLSDVLRDNEVYLGGSSMGKGLKKAARYYIQSKLAGRAKPDYLKGNDELLEDAVTTAPILEDSFYVVDLGILVSQVYQWRRYFPRVEPYYAVKCNPDPVIVKTLAVLGCNFDCASRNEIRLVQSLTKEVDRDVDIIYANPCKARQHLVEAVCKGVRKVTFDNVTEVKKCAAISRHIQLILRIITDDRGSQCRLSAKFGAPRNKWRPLLAAAKQHGLAVVGVSFHVGSGCRDASRYVAALQDAREIFDMAKSEFGFEMNILDIGGGFPGETHSMWNPAAELDPETVAGEDDEEDDDKEGITDKKDEEVVEENDHFMFFTEIAEQVAPVIDEFFPVDEGVKVIAEPGRYFVAACATLCCSVVSARSNELDTKFEPEAIIDREVAQELHEMTREEEGELVGRGGGRVRSMSRGRSLNVQDTDAILNTIHEGLVDYSRLYASQQLVQQEVDVYNDSLDLFHEGFATAGDLLGPPDDFQKHRRHHTVEGMSYSLIGTTSEGTDDVEGTNGTLLTLAAAGEAAVNGVVLQAMADSAPLQDDFAYYINDSVYGAFNNIMFDHATIRPRVLRNLDKVDAHKVEGGFQKLDSLPGTANHSAASSLNGSEHDDLSTGSPNLVPPPFQLHHGSEDLFASTVWGCTCDSIDLLIRSALLPKLQVGDYLYFQNMGAYTMAAASSFNGFTPSERFYVCSVKPDYFKDLIQGPESSVLEEKKEN